MNTGALTILYLVTEDWYFYSHRLGLARAAQTAGHRVVVGTRCNRQRAALEREGFTVVDLPFERSLRTPWRDLRAWWLIRRLLGALQPDIVHLVALKPTLLGGLALRSRRMVPTLCAVAGLGYIFSSSDRLARLLRAPIVAAFRFIAGHPQVHVLTQNDTDRDFLLTAAIAPPARCHVIHGSGIDLAAYPPAPLPPPSAPLVLLPARLLVDKGIYEFVAAARVLRARWPTLRCVLAGAHDRDNHAAVSAAELERWLAEGVIEWHGHVRDMVPLYHAASVVCLPSYREGLPRALLEAAACARPLVATDVPGCREICRHEHTGLLVPPRTVAPLAAAIATLLHDRARAERYAQAAHAVVAAEFALAPIAAATLALYDVMHAQAAAPAE